MSKRWSAVLSVVLFCVGCSSGGHPSAGPPKSCLSGSGASGWVRSDLHPVTQPLVAGCHFVLYDASGGVLRVVALDAATGRTVWQIKASASSVTPGVSPTLAVTE